MEFCNASVAYPDWVGCRPANESKLRPTREEFYDYLQWYLLDNPTSNCSEGGHAAYYYAVDYDPNDKGIVGPTYYMAYHSVCKTSADYTDALRQARKISKNITDMLG